MCQKCRGVGDRTPRIGPRVRDPQEGGAGISTGSVRGVAKEPDGDGPIEVKTRGAAGAAYPLSIDDHELRRLDRPGRALAPATEFVLRSAGLRSGMQVLDLGSGAGDVAFLARDIVGPSGRVVGIDQSPAAVDRARARAEHLCHRNVGFVVRDAHDETTDLGPFDAVIGRLVLMYAPDPAEMLRRQAASLVPGGLIAAVEFDVASCRSLPPVPLVEWLVDVACEAFARAGTDLGLGPRLWSVLTGAGLTARGMTSVQPHFGPNDPDGAFLLAGILRSTASLIERTGVAASADLGLDSYESRLRAELEAVNGVVAYPTFFGAWGTA